MEERAFLQPFLKVTNKGLAHECGGYVLGDGESEPSNVQRMFCLRTTNVGPVGSFLPSRMETVDMREIEDEQIDISTAVSARERESIWSKRASGRLAQT